MEAHRVDADVVVADLHEAVARVVGVVSLPGSLDIEQADSRAGFDAQEAVDVVHPRRQPNAQHVNPRPRADLEADLLASVAGRDLEDRLGEPVLLPALDDVAAALPQRDEAGRVVRRAAAGGDQRDANAGQEAPPIEPVHVLPPAAGFRPTRNRPPGQG